jgi:formamidopyrimidine-DNA glycosylase
MPELPEVEAVRRGLFPVVGRAIVRVEVLRRDVIEGTPTTNSPIDPAWLLAGSAVERLERRGKQLAVIGTSGRVVVIQLGMSGQVRTLAVRPSTLPTHTHVVWTYAEGSVTLFRDPRRFGGLTLAASEDTLRAEHWADLGPDALGIEARHFAHAAGRSARALKAILLDQHVLAGVGNIYADEALFRARLAPRRLGKGMRTQEWDRLALAVREVLRAAVNAGGSTLRDYVRPDGTPGNAVHDHAVYGRGGLPCLNCGTRLRKATVAQRTTVWCPWCQTKEGKAGSKVLHRLSTS